MPADRETQTITSADVGVLDLRENPASPAVATPASFTLETLKPGMQVMFVDVTLNTHPTCWVETPHESNARAVAGKPAMVVAVEPNKPGKVIALCFKDKIAGGHSCDGRVPDGHGAYAMPAHLYSVEAWQAHKTACDAALMQQKSIDEMIKGFFTP